VWIAVALRGVLRLAMTMDLISAFPELMTDA
jgi:hypothetical protein